MKKNILILLIAIGLFILASCNKNETENTPQSFVPKITASVGGSVDSKAGVVENNPNYTTGELFRWDLNDETLVNFVDPVNSSVISTTYKVETVHDPANKADFVISTGTPPSGGIYHVKAFFPVSAWNFTENPGFATLTIPVGAGGGSAPNKVPVQTLGYGEYLGMTSESLGQDVSLPIDLTFKHHTALVRIVLRNDLGRNVVLGDVALMTGGARPSVFPNKGKISMSDLNTAIAIDNLSLIHFISHGSVSIPSASDYEFFLVSMPTAFSAGGFQVYAYEGTASGVPFFSTPLAATQLEAGKSYYLHVLLSSLMNLPPV